MSELLRSASHAQLAAYLEQHHELLAPLLPADTSCDDLFNEVGADGSHKETSLTRLRTLLWAGS